MNKFVDKMWRNLCVSLCENCEKSYKKMWNFIKIVLNCEKNSDFTHLNNGFTLGFTQEKYLCYFSRLYTISTGFIITIMNYLLKRDYNKVRRCV